MFHYIILCYIITITFLESSVFNLVKSEKGLLKCNSLVVLGHSKHSTITAQIDVHENGWLDQVFANDSSLDHNELN